MPGDLLRTIAGDLGIQRMHDESETQLACRASYSALRFWIEAFCLDDGYGGTCGISETAIIRKSTIWLRNLEDLYPGLLHWYRFDSVAGKSIANILRMLVAVQDLTATDEELYRCATSHTSPLGTRYDLILGMTDPTSQSDAFPMSGMASITRNDQHRPVVSVVSAAPAGSSATLADAGAERNEAVFKPAADRNHVMITLNRPLPNASYCNQLYMMTWPTRTVNDQTKRLARIEYVPALAELLRSNGIHTYRQEGFPDV
ncbi:hypothetical protein [Bifidobacterium jacchi]|uniref:Uncharacterized protein n=1 Tax=Bifidobacterium jacchi TaxID=2490545 RepID=A0A5N5RC98_9BIFI|nr:hypothetical protein [Bifidobacterium jacchi]KAB5603609.1 hypothetical protein EHS19_10285 [Bifidobacterium jacchi]